MSIYKFMCQYISVNNLIQIFISKTRNVLKITRFYILLCANSSNSSVSCSNAIFYNSMIYYTIKFTWHLLAGTEQKHVNLNLGSWSKGQNVNLRHSEYEMSVTVAQQ